MLYDGGFHRQMLRFDDVVSDVVDNSFRPGQHLYRSLFSHSNNYSWFVPSENVYTEAIYELAFTYLGRIDSDVLGQVYERLLLRIDRKLLGQYYTPRDIIALIWNLIGFEEMSAEAEQGNMGARRESSTLLQAQADFLSRPFAVSATGSRPSALRAHLSPFSLGSTIS